MIPACNAAPAATASSGFIPLKGFLPIAFSRAFCTAGILVEPPISITLSISFLLIFASLRALNVGFIVDSTSFDVNSSNFALVSETSRCSGCPSFIVINGKLICVCVVPDSSILAFSADSFNLLMA